MAHMQTPPCVPLQQRHEATILPPAPGTPAAGDYGVWTAEAQQLVERWAPGFAQAGCTLSLQRTRDFWLQIGEGCGSRVCLADVHPALAGGACWARDAA